MSYCRDLQALLEFMCCNEHMDCRLGDQVTRDLLAIQCNRGVVCLKARMGMANDDKTQ